MTTKLLTMAGALALGGALLWAAPAVASHQSCDCSESLCSAQGFEITLVDFSVDQFAGTSSWTYKVCNDEDQGGDCVPPKDLSHVDFVLPGLAECVTDTQEISVQQLGCPACDPVLTCGASDKDPSCDLCKAGTGVPGVPCVPPDSPPIRVLKCDVSGGDLDPGECVTIQITIAGESPTVGPGAVDTVTKAGPDCESDGICGPACDCAQEGGGCLTRTAGFWGTHPHITALFLPITVCGDTLNTTDAGVCDSASEALCVAPGLEANRRCDRNPAYAGLVRQLAAAKLNLAATAANGGSCDSGIASLIAQCEGFCGKGQAAISRSGCIELLDEFNNSQDTVELTPSPFDRPGPADPDACKEANGNGIVIGKNCELDCR